MRPIRFIPEPRTQRRRLRGRFPLTISPRRPGGEDLEVIGVANLLSTVDEDGHLDTLS